MSQAESQMTIDHDEIRRWAQQRKGKPSTVKRTEGKRGEAGILRIDFPGFSGKGSLEEISWDEFFEKFEQSKLALLYQEKTADGKKSNFNKLVKRPANLKSGRSTLKSGSGKASQAKSKTTSRGSAKAGTTPSKTKSRTQAQNRSRTTAKPKTAAKTKTAPKAATKAAPRSRATAAKSKSRTSSRTTAKPQAKTKSRSQAKSSANPKTAARTKRLARSKARAK